MRRYWRIYRTFFTSSLVRELEFKANFLAKIVQNLLWITFFLLILMVIYRNTQTIGGWGRGEAFVLAATVFLMNAIVNAFFFSLTEIPQHVRMGTLDYVITKPVDTQFWISARRFNFDQIGTIFAGIVMVAVGVIQTAVHPSFLQWICYGLMLACAIAIFYSFNLLLMTTGIWLVKVDNLWVLGETITSVVRFPIDIFPFSVRRAFTFIVPLAFLATIPTRQLTRGIEPSMVGLGMLWALGALLVSRTFWRFALRHYSSASS